MYNDATGEQLSKPYPVGVLFDNKMHVVDVDRDNLESDLAGLNLLDVVKRGRVEKGLRRNSRTSLNAQLHSEARAWAKENDVPVGDRGKVPEEVLSGYLQACGAQAPDSLGWLVSDE